MGKVTFRYKSKKKIFNFWPWELVGGKKSKDTEEAL